MDNNNMKMIKEAVYNVLQKPTRENFIDILSNGFGEQDNLDFKGQWNDYQKLSEIILGIANSGGGAIILGVKENDDGTMEALGLKQLEDKEKVYGKIQKFLPDTLEFSIGDFDFTDESYSKIEGKLFQILFVSCKEVELPYVWKKDSNGAGAGGIFYRRGTKTVKANMQEITDMIDKRIKASCDEQSNLQLEEHLKQLDTLYKYITPKTYSVSLYDKLFRNLNNTMSNSAIISGVSNPNYPKESYEEFIEKMIERKKKKIEWVLDLK